MIESKKSVQQISLILRPKIKKKQQAKQKKLRENFSQK